MRNLSYFRAVPYHRILDLIWFVLMAMTLLSALIAESAEPSLLVTAIVALTIGIKGRLVVDRFMELRNANPRIRFAMNLYFYLLPLAILIVWLFPEFLADMTRLKK
ncbi:cytochrome C oxidase subunit IV family protein [Motiliproteus sp. MSK22-1]|uniref:cytochrome C oxidase subunit IV family protein n=1 Tax=Motiliproteus sp. MSK22-1 TaxID=1897630 RepID=UPI000976FA48|nr:cytochrome C oxidase subunit IV family protein [Motiliproteus sp. MSK22-1]OMH25853.1 hypothetical protein BGP75_25400 [Motiliproteus sp. MSK22-1]